MTKKKEPKVDIVNVDLGDFLTGVSDESNKLGFEEAVSKGLLYSLKKFSKTSRTNKYDAKAMSVLMATNKTMKDICESIINLRKDHKRTKEKLWKQIIISLGKSIKLDKMDDDGMFSFLRRDK